MKFLASLLLIGATSAPVLAGPATGYKSSGGFAREEKCFKTEYREEYVPGTAKNPGYVKSFKKKVRVPCQPKVRYIPAPEPHIHSDRSDSRTDGLHLRSGPDKCNPSTYGRYPVETLETVTITSRLSHWSTPV